MIRPPAAAVPRRQRQLLTGIKISLLVMVALVVPTMVVLAFVHRLPDSRGGEFKTHHAANSRGLGSQPSRPMFGGGDGGGLGIGSLGSMLRGGGAGKQLQGQEQHRGGEDALCVAALLMRQGHAMAARRDRGCRHVVSLHPSKCGWRSRALPYLLQAVFTTGAAWR